MNKLIALAETVLKEILQQYAIVTYIDILKCFGTSIKTDCLVN